MNHFRGSIPSIPWAKSCSGTWARLSKPNCPTSSKCLFPLTEDCARLMVHASKLADFSAHAGWRTNAHTILAVFVQPVLRIHDILGWIRIRGSMRLTHGSGSGSFYFRHWPARCQQKTHFLTQFFWLMTFSSYIYIIFQRYKFKKSPKIGGIKVFLTIFAWW